MSSTFESRLTCRVCITLPRKWWTRWTVWGRHAHAFVASTGSISRDLVLTNVSRTSLGLRSPSHLSLALVRVIVDACANLPVRVNCTQIQRSFRLPECRFFAFYSLRSGNLEPNERNRHADPFSSKSIPNRVVTKSAVARLLRASAGRERQGSQCV